MAESFTAILDKEQGYFPENLRSVDVTGCDFIQQASIDQVAKAYYTYNGNGNSVKITWDSFGFTSGSRLGNFQHHGVEPKDRAKTLVSASSDADLGFGYPNRSAFFALTPVRLTVNGSLFAYGFDTIFNAQITFGGKAGNNQCRLSSFSRTPASRFVDNRFADIRSSNYLGCPVFFESSGSPGFTTTSGSGLGTYHRPEAQDTTYISQIVSSDGGSSSTIVVLLPGVESFS